MALLSDSANLAAALTALGNYGDLYVNANETLGETTYNIPDGVTLHAFGGVLTIQAGTTINQNGLLRGNTQIYDNTALGTINWDSGQSVNPEWFGLKNIRLGGTGANNAIAFRSAWQAASAKGVTVMGGAVEIPARAYYLTETDIRTYTHLGTKPLIGVAGAQFYLPNSTNTPLMHIKNLFEQRITDISFVGNRGANTMPADGALVECWPNFYSNHFEKIRVTGSAGHGMRVNGGAHFTFINCKFDTSTGYGLILENVAHAMLFGVDVESSGGLLLKGGESSYGNANIVVRGLYAEACDPACVIDNQGHCVISNILQTPGPGVVAVRLINGSSNNEIDITAAWGDVVIEHGCRDNLIWVNPSNPNARVIDQNTGNGRNEIRCKWEDRKHWRGHTTALATIQPVTTETLNYSVDSVDVGSDTFTWRLWLSAVESPRVYWDAYDLIGLKFFDPINNTWGDGSATQQLTIVAGEPTYIALTITTGQARRLRLRVWVDGRGGGTDAMRVHYSRLVASDGSEVAIA